MIELLVPSVPGLPGAPEEVVVEPRPLLEGEVPRPDWLLEFPDELMLPDAPGVEELTPLWLLCPEVDVPRLPL